MSASTGVTMSVGALTPGVLTLPVFERGWYDACPSCSASVACRRGLSACGSSATAPGGNNNPTTTYYAGVFASAGATGSFTATTTTPASSDVVVALSADPLGSGSSAPSGSGVHALSGTQITIIVTLINPAKSFTLTGTV